MFFVAKSDRKHIVITSCFHGHHTNDDVISLYMYMYMNRK